MNRLPLLIALTLTPCCGGAVSTTSVLETAIELELPTVLDLQEGILPVVHVTLGEHTGQSFLVDSGASISLIDLVQARELGLPVQPYSHATTTSGSGGGSVAYDSYAVTGLIEVGDLSLEGSRLPAIDLDMLRDMGLVGILGQDVLGRIPVLIDMQRRELHCLPEGTQSEAIAEYLRDAGIGEGTWAQVPVEFRPCPFVPLEIEGLVGAAPELEIDTGAISSSLPARAIEALRLVSTGTSTSRGIGGTYEEATYALEDFGLYGFFVSFEIKRSPLEYGLLGMDVLGEFVILLDGPGERLWLHHRSVDPKAGAGD